MIIISDWQKWKQAKIIDYRTEQNILKTAPVFGNISPILLKENSYLSVCGDLINWHKICYPGSRHQLRTNNQEDTVHL